MSGDASPSRSAALFLQLVLGLQQSGMMALGKLMHPITRKVEVHLEVARDTIDTLGAIEARTRGNLEPDEERVLRQALTDLRLNYVAMVRKSATNEAGGASSGVAGDAGAGDSSASGGAAAPASEPPAS